MPILLRYVYIGLSILIVGSVSSLAWAGDDIGDADLWAEHPALQSFDLSGQELPRELYLVRSRAELPVMDGIVVHGVFNDVSLVSGDPVAIMGLTQKGHAVIPLREKPAAPRFASRQWTQLVLPDPAITDMVAQVDWAGVSDKIQWLVDRGTRYSFAPNHFAVADSIGTFFSSYGLQPTLRSFEYGGTTMWNVEATQTGTVYPDSFFILCGHFDAVSENSMVSAPGADDNGTGTATVLTAAEILAQHQFEYSIRYVCFGGEEQGLRGSAAYASWAVAQGLGIVGVLNFDMMGYWETGVPKDLEIETNNASQWLAAAIVNAADLYTHTPYLLHVYDGAYWGDHVSFWDEGFAAVNHEEAWDWYDPDFNPYYHSTDDLLTHVDSSFTVGNIKVCVAALATLAGFVPDITGVGDPVTPPSLAGSLSAYPNPFQKHVTFTVSGLPDRDNVRILVYDVRGREVAAVPVLLHNGQGIAFWNTFDDLAREIGTGVFFGKLEGIPGAPPVKIVHVK
jgi:aminopeptidase YwaD